MKFNGSFYVCLAVAVFCLPFRAFAQPYLSQTYHPSLCEAVNSRHAERLAWMGVGLGNKDADKAVWVNCSFTFSEIESYFWGGYPAQIAVMATNEASESAELFCALKVVDWRESTPVQRYHTVSRSYQSGETARLVLDADWGGFSYSTRQVQCKLPPGMAISAYQLGSLLDEEL